MVLVGAAYVCQQHRAVIYLCWPHGSWSESLARVLISTWWAGRLLPALSREERALCQGKPCGVGLCISRLCQALLWPYPDFSLTSSSCRKMRSSEKYLRLYVQRKYWKGSGLKFKCSLEGIPSFSAHSWYRYFLLEMSCAFH